MDEQTQNVQPDYSFITNQPAEPEQKKSKKKLVFIGVGAFVLLVGFAALLVGMTTTNVQQATGSEEQTAAAKLFLGYLAKDSVDENAYTMLSKDLFLDKEKNAHLLNRFRSGVNFSSCAEPTSKQDESGSQDNVFTCKTKLDKNVAINIVTKTQEGKVVVAAHKMEVI